MGVHTPVQIAKPAHPLEELVGRIALHRLGRPVDHHHTLALFHERIKFLQLAVQHMPPVPCAENHDRGRIVQNTLVLRITDILEHHRLHRQSGFVERLGQQHVSRPMLMRQPPVTRFSGDKHHLGLVSRIDCRTGQQSREHT